MAFSLLLLILFAAGLWLVFFFLLPPLFQVSQIVGRRLHRWLLARSVWKRIAPLSSGPWRAYLPVIGVLAVGTAVTLLGGWIFLELADSLHQQDTPVREVDQQIYGWARGLRNTEITPLFVWATVVGTPVGLAVIVAIFSSILALQKRFRWVAYLAFTGIGGGLMNILLKSFFVRSRPDLAEALRQAHGYSFPSGHAMGTTIVMAALSYLAMRATASWSLRSAALSVATTLVILISFSRIYLGVHWASDIAAGIAAGAIWVAATTLGYEVFRRIRALRATRQAAPLGSAIPAARR